MRQGETIANVCFNIIVARLYRKFISRLGGRDIIFKLADDLKMASEPEVLAEVVHTVHALAKSEVSLTT